MAGEPRLFGRRADLQQLEALLRDPRCVSLVGTAGVGKTSLARTAGTVVAVAQVVTN